MERADPGHHGELPDSAWTVGQLNREIDEALEDQSNRFPTHIVGEIAEVSDYGFGTFFELRDLADDPSISCLAWAGDVDSFEHDLTAGTEAVVEATVDFYPDRGDCQLLVSGYWPLGESTRQQELKQLRAQLAGEGLFDEAARQPIPDHPDCIGLVTSPAGSAREDVWATVSERSPRTEVCLCGATVQGEDAVPSLLGAIERLDRDPAVETLILTRGGGSDADLWSFNAEPLVRKVGACSTPVVVAIGHEDDETLVEAAADARAMTPTEAGVVATTPTEEVLEQLAVLERRIDHGYRTLVESRLEALDRRVGSAHEALTRQVQRRDAVRDRAADLDRRIGLAYGGLVESRLDTLEREIEQSARALAGVRLDALEDRLDTAMVDLELAAESDAATARATRHRLDDIRARIESAYRARTTRELDDIERRIDHAYRQVRADTRVDESERAARRLRFVVAALAVVLVLVAGVALVLFLAGGLS
jgi:exodeoxyribonuclease VII large subunit